MTLLFLGLPWIFPMPQFFQLLIFLLLHHPYCSKLLHIYTYGYIYTYIHMYIHVHVFFLTCVFLNVAGHKQTIHNTQVPLLPL